ncbi:unnamed protein product [Caenorhabditis brenneri]
MSRLLEKDLKRPDLKGEFECKMCGQKFLHAASLRRHRNTHHLDGLTCQLCNKGIQNETVKQHMRVEHLLKTVYTCGCCNWTFLDKSQFHRHTKSMKETGQPGDVVAIVVSGVAPGSLSQDNIGSQETPKQTNQVASPVVNAPPLEPAMLNLLSEFLRNQNFVPQAQEPIVPVPSSQDVPLMFPNLGVLLQAAAMSSGAPPINTEDEENIPLIDTKEPSTSSMSSQPDSGNGSLSVSPDSSTSAPRTPMEPQSPSTTMSRLSSNELKRPDLKGEFECKMCGQKFLHAASLRRHRNTHHLDGLTCQLCNKGIQNETVKQHMRVEHLLKTVYTCGCCSWTFLDKSQFHRHTKSMKETGQPGDVVAIVVSGVTPGSLSQDNIGSQETPKQTNQVASPVVNAPPLEPAMLNLLSEFLRTQNFVPPAQEPIVPAPSAQDALLMFPTLGMLLQAAMSSAAPQNSTEDKENVPLMDTEKPSTSLMSSRPDSGNGSLSISPDSSTLGPRTPPMVQKGRNKRLSVDNICLQLSAKRAASF